MAFSGFSGFGAASRPAAEFPVLPPEEEESLLRRIMGGFMGGLQYVGQTLDKPGAAVRGLLSGQPDQLLNLIPFSDTLGITDPTERVYGRDLLKQAGMFTENDPNKWFELGDIAGFATDVVTDPLSYLNPLGALTKGGHLAKSVGILEDLPSLAKQRSGGTLLPGKRAMRSENTLDDLIQHAKSQTDAIGQQRIDEAVQGAASKFGYDLQEIGGQRLGGSVGLSLGPFGRSVAPGGGPGSVGAYGALLDKIGGGIANSGVGRGVQSLFSKPLMGQTNPVAQQELRGLDRNKGLIQTEASRDMFRFKDDLDSALMSFNLKPNDDLVIDSLRAYAELGPNYRDPTKGGFANLPDLPKQAKDLVEQLVVRHDQFRAELVGTGLIKDHQFQSQYGLRHFFRQGTDHLKGGKVVDKSLKFQRGQYAFDRDKFYARHPVLRDLPGGTVQIERLLRDPRLTQGTGLLSPGRRHRIISQRVYGLNRTDFTAARVAEKNIKNGTITFQQLPPAEQLRLTKWREARKVGKYLKKKETRDYSTRMFGRHMLEDDRTYTVATRGATATANAVTDMFAQSAQDMASLLTTKTPQQITDEFVSLGSAFKKAGFKDADLAVNNFLGRTQGRFTPKAQILVPKEMAESAATILKKFQNPDEIDKFLTMFDRYAVNLFKVGATAHPGFHVRNWVSGTVQNVISGAYNFLNAGKYIRRGHQFSAGKTVEGLSKHEGIKRLFPGLNDDEATKKLAELVETYGLRGNRFDELLEHIDDTTGKPTTGRNPYDRLNQIYPKQSPTSIPQMWKTAKAMFQQEPDVSSKIGAFLNPNRIPGVGKDVVQDTNILSRVHKDAGRYTEDINRVGAFLGYLDQGFSPSAAAQRVKATHVDYRNLSNFDKAFMRRIFPFWSFFKGITDNTVKEILEHPGGKLSQTIRLSDAARQGEEGYVPGYIGEGLAIPLGPDKFISRLGLMHEAPFDAFAYRSMAGDDEDEPMSVNLFDTGKRTLQKLGSMANPVIKTPIEWATDTQLFTGRSHKDLHPYPFTPDSMLRSDVSLISNMLLGASPASRAIRSVRKLEDERKSLPEKALSTLTGLGLTDVYGGVERARELDADRVKDELLKESPRIREYSTLYSPADFKGALTPTERALLRLQSTTNKRNRERAKEAAKAG